MGLPTSRSTEAPPYLPITDVAGNSTVSRDFPVPSRRRSESFALGSPRVSCLDILRGVVRIGVDERALEIADARLQYT